MAASPEKIREVVEQYVARVATGTTDEVLELFADGATVEDPVGSGVRTTREAIRDFYSGLESLEQAGEVLSVRIAGGQAAFLFELRTHAGEQTYTLAPIDVMTFDDEGQITSMRAYWSDVDLVVGGPPS
ncbi:MAG TPA: nuclear transport factor 2 family protein [Nocardioides sp.]|uniref:nuclear transport factor 2 family protein n=1 Tax=Nocardioides sp. TaxID=35761 RepID=UPI002E360EE9|nr:nuclear transport factor 2 family protein [Nocardioides sp.]HEX5087332.1 nuclear transport factor 2 family protein [Nocardioides sp.]